jgi:hypothetical protein
MAQNEDDDKKQRGAHRRGKKREASSSSRLPFSADYNDHFETPQRAYADLAQAVIDRLIPAVNGSAPKELPRTSITLYDPYYCQGRTKELLQELGFTSVVHDCRDFYRDIREKQVPHHDFLVTNPPYSESHKEQCLRFAFSQLQPREEEKGRSFGVLLPAYVTLRQYYRQILNEFHVSDDDTAGTTTIAPTSTQKRICVFYVVPHVAYEYDHPEGTGKDQVPFVSLWICGVQYQHAQQIFQQYERQSRLNYRLFRSIRELEIHGIVSGVKRPNPRQRRTKQKAQTSAPSKQKLGKPTLNLEAPAQVTKASRPSKYRDESGKRKRGRF